MPDSSLGTWARTLCLYSSFSFLSVKWVSRNWLRGAPYRLPCFRFGPYLSKADLQSCRQRGVGFSFLDPNTCSITSVTSSHIVSLFLLPRKLFSVGFESANAGVWVISSCFRSRFDFKSLSIFSAINRWSFAAAWIRKDIPVSIALAIVEGSSFEQREDFWCMFITGSAKQGRTIMPNPREEDEALWLQ